MHIDTDEYVVPSKAFRRAEPTYIDLPPINEHGSVLKLLQRASERTPNLINYPCVSMLRLLFGSVEKADDWTSIHSNIPDGFNPLSFESLRWRYHAPPANMSFHGSPKVIIDVSVIPLSYFSDDIAFSIHRPMKEICRANKNLDYKYYYENPIGTNHYLGSWERYNSRNDNRRSRDLYDAKATAKNGSDDGIHLWLNGFVDGIGGNTAKQLLPGKYLLSNGTASFSNFQKFNGHL